MGSRETGVKTLLFISFVIVVNVVFLIDDFEFSRYSIGRDLVSVYDKRFRAVRQFLPENGVVGYITDNDPQEVFSDSYAIQRFYLTRYALSPLVVVNSTDQKHVVGDFHNSQPNIKDCESKGLSVVKDYGNGVILFKRRTEP